MDKKNMSVAGSLILGIFLVVSLWQVVLVSNKTQVAFFDIGQGDASFIETTKGFQILIDGGPDSSVLEKLDMVLPWWDKTIDMVILSHPAADHVTGLIDVLRKYKVKHILWNGIEKDTMIFKEWKNAMAKEHAIVTIGTSGQRIVIQEGECPEYFDILYPVDDITGKRFVDDNDTSVVVRFVSCKGSVLFTGDLTSKGEQKILERELMLDSDVLKVGHHGSKTSSSIEFIKAVSPNTAIISSGEGNRYGHPHQDILARFLQFGIDIQRTDQQGDITIQF